MKFIPVNKPSINNSDIKIVNKCIRSGWVSSSGKYINLFEQNFKKKVKRKYAVAVSSGTAALDIAIKSLNLKAGDEVIVPNFSIISCVNEIIREKLKPIFIDADPLTLNMNLDLLEKKITKKTKAIIVVHIYGLPVDMKRVIKIAKKYRLFLIEDAAEQLGQTYDNQPIGSFGDISTFSFFANKHITTGEGGMVVTNKKSLYEKFLMFRNISFSLKKQRFIHDDIGWNYRLTNLQAALGYSQLKRLNKFVKIKRKIGDFYWSHLKDYKNIQLPLKKIKNSTNIYWVFSIILKNNISAKKIINLMNKEKIECRPFFFPLNEQPIIKKLKLNNKGDFSISKKLWKKGFYIPSGIGTSKKELATVIKKLNKIFLKLKI